MAEAWIRGEFRSFTLGLVDMAILREYLGKWTRFTKGSGLAKDPPEKEARARSEGT
jgi:hypothetical protein